MITRSKYTTPPDRNRSDHDLAQFESIDSWLAVFVRLLPLPDEDRDEIAGELEGHLREQVRDLMVSGHDERQAVQIAVSEIGNIAELATRFGKAHSYPKRRRLMHAAIATAAVGVIGIGALTMVAPEQGANFSVFQEKVASLEMQAVLDRRIDADFEDMAFGDVVAFMAETLDENFVISVRDMEDHGISPADTMIHFRLSNVRVGKVLDLLEEQVNGGLRYLTWHVGDDVIEFGNRERFDRRTSELVSYDIAPILLSMWERYDIEYEDAMSQIADVLMSMVSPEDWHDMGGDLAHMNFVGGKIFIEAPKHMHEQIAWILSELVEGDQSASAVGGPFGSAAGATVDAVGSAAATPSI